MPTRSLHPTPGEPPRLFSVAFGPARLHFALGEYMTRTWRRFIIAAASFAVGLIVVVLAAPAIQRSLFYPKPHGLPPVIDVRMDQLLTRLQSVLETNAALVMQVLQPGLSDAQISTLEKEGGFRFSDDLRALYRWHNGVATNSTLGLIPGHRFLPLEELMRVHLVRLKQVKSAGVLQRAAFAAVAGHRKSWVQVFDDETGDGYFFDPLRSDAEGAFFSCFAEAGYYVWFPSLRNFLSGVVDCYATGAFKVATNGAHLEEDVRQSAKIWQRYAKASEE